MALDPNAPGTKLDLWLAEHFFRFPRIEHPISGVTTYDRPQVYVNLVPALPGISGSERYPLPFYSTNLDAAMFVLQELLSRKQPDGDPFSVKILCQSDYRGNYMIETGINHFLAAADTLPHAICLAAKSAVGQGLVVQKPLV